MKSILHLSPNDNVVICVEEKGLKAGSEIFHPIDQSSIRLQADIPRGHKIAIREIKSGERVLKFNHTIAVASQNIKAGEHVHTQNCRMPQSDELDLSADAISEKVELKTQNLPRTFQGYLRKNGSVGIRNYVAIVASVNCSATVVKAICNHFKPQDLGQFGIDGIVPITHQSGCAQAIGGLNFNTLNKTIAGWVFHPNVVGAVLIGLGCEGTTPSSILEFSEKMKIQSDIPMEKFSIQDVGGTALAIAEGIKRVEKLLEKLPKFERKPVPVSKLALALNCGGSDSFSSLTANPALGVASDILTSLQGTSVLAEIPECHGAEFILETRATSQETVKKLQDTFNWWHRYSETNAVSLNNNLAPGNIAGGITTIVEKSLGAVSKAGNAPLNDVVEYAAPLTKNGFVLMNTPGFDPVSVTGLVAGGCQIVAFTTGRGSVYGASIAPTIKISTTSQLFARMSGDMDFNAGEVLEGKSVQEVGIEFYKFLISIASGEKTKSEMLGLGWEEFVPWPLGETL